MLILTEINNSTNRPKLVAISDSKDGLYKCGEIVVSEHFRQQT